MQAKKAGVGCCLTLPPVSDNWDTKPLPSAAAAMLAEVYMQGEGSEGPANSSRGKLIPSARRPCR